MSEFQFRAEMEAMIRVGIKKIAKQSALIGVDDEFWDVSRLSWTGSEWPGFQAIPGLCYVEAFEHGNPPHDFLFVVSVRGGVPSLLASYEGDMDAFELTLWGREAEPFGFPERVPR